MRRNCRINRGLFRHKRRKLIIQLLRRRSLQHNEGFVNGQRRMWTLFRHTFVYFHHFPDWKWQTEWTVFDYSPKTHLRHRNRKHVSPTWTVTNVTQFPLTLVMSRRLYRQNTFILLRNIQHPLPTSPPSTTRRDIVGVIQNRRVSTTDHLVWYLQSHAAWIRELINA